MGSGTTSGMDEIAPGVELAAQEEAEAKAAEAGEAVAEAEEPGP